ncbi:MAG: hypothetical protein ABH868_02855 [bacterium]
MGTLKKQHYIWVIAIFLINFAFYVIRPGNETVIFISSHIFTNLCALIAVLSLFRAFSAFKILDLTKAAWLMLLIGVFFYLLGELAYSFYEVLRKLAIPFPSIADGFRLASYVFLFAVVIYLIRGFRKAGIPIGAWTEFLSITLLLGSIFYFLSIDLFAPIMASPVFSAYKKFLYIAYPLADLTLIFLILILMQFTALFGQGIFYDPWRYILAGFIAIAVGNILFAYYTWHNLYAIGSYIDLFPNLGYLLIALGAMSQKNLIRKP